MQRFVGKTASDIRNHPMLLTVPEMLFAFLSVFTCLLYIDGVMPDSIPPEMQRLFLLSFLFIGLMRFFRAEGNRYRRSDAVVSNGYVYQLDAPDSGTNAGQEYTSSSAPTPTSSLAADG